MADKTFRIKNDLVVNGNFTANSSQVTLGANVTINTAAVSLGNSTVNAVVTTTLVSVANSGGSANLDPLKLLIGAVTQNSTGFFAGANAQLTTTTLSVGNSTANAFANSILVKVANSSGIANIQPGLLTIGVVTVNTTTVAVGSNAVLVNNATATIGAGFTIAPFNAGTKSSGTFTPAPASGNYQYAASNGAFTLAAPSSDCAIDILLTNGTGAGTITFSGFTVGTTGDALTTTSTNKFLVSIRRINSVATYIIKALQ